MNILYNYDKNLTMKDESLAFNDIFLGVVLDTRILFCRHLLYTYRGAGNKKNAASYFLFRCGDTAEKSDWIIITTFPVTSVYLYLYIQYLLTTIWTRQTVFNWNESWNIKQLFKLSICLTSKQNRQNYWIQTMLSNLQTCFHP